MKTDKHMNKDCTTSPIEPQFAESGAFGFHIRDREWIYAITKSNLASGEFFSMRSRKDVCNRVEVWLAVNRKRVKVVAFAKKEW